jgi:hypothetical protein
MMRTLTVVLGLGVLLVAGKAGADDDCPWKGSLYGEGAMSCQAGAQARCVDGRWKLTGSQCADQAADPSGEEDEPAVREPSVAQPSVE